MLSKLKVQKDWWTANAILWILSGVIGILYGLSANPESAGKMVVLFSGGITVAVGLALLQRSKLAFWITMVVAALTFFNQLPEAVTAYNLDTSFFISIITLVFAVMLWQEVKGKKAKK